MTTAGHGRSCAGCPSFITYLRGFLIMRILKSAAAFVAVLVAAALAGVPASAAAPPPVRISLVGYNANGNDVESNRWKEFIELKNVSGAAVNVEGWYTQDAWAHSNRKTGADDCNVAVFAAATVASDATRFQHLSKDNPDTGDVETSGLWLPKGETIRVYTGGNADTTNNGVHTIALNKPNCGYNGHYLGNGGDTVYLKDKDHKVVAKFTYSFEHGYYVR